jgi:large subunit ribosomal protein L9
MEIILKQDVQGLGYKNDLVKVKPGYGRNYLIPNGMALMATESNKAAKLKLDAEELAQKLADLTVEIGTKAGENGRIFGAITGLQVSEALKAKGFEVDRKRVTFKSQPKELGEYKAVLDLHKEVKHEITVKVVAE